MGELTWGFPASFDGFAAWGGLGDDQEEESEAFMGRGMCGNHRQEMNERILA